MKTPKEIIKKEIGRIRKKKLYQTLIKRAPNIVRITTIERILPEYSSEEILESANQLKSENLIDVTEISNEHLPERKVHAFKAKNAKNFPITEKINIGNIEFPRLLDGDDVIADDINVFIEALAEYDNKIESRIENLASDMTRRYWADVSTLVGLFVSVFALILRSSDPIVVNGLSDAKSLFYLKLAEVGPLAIVLFLFVILLRLAIKKL